MTLFSLILFTVWLQVLTLPYVLLCIPFAMFFLKRFLEHSPSFLHFLFNSSSQIVICMRHGYISFLLDFPKLVTSPFSIQRTDELIFLTCYESLPYPPICHHMKIVLHLLHIYCINVLWTSNFPVIHKHFHFLPPYCFLYSKQCIKGESKYMGQVLVQSQINSNNKVTSNGCVGSSRSEV